MPDQPSRSMTAASSNRTWKFAKRWGIAGIYGVAGSLFVEMLRVGIAVLGIGGYGIAWYFFCLVVSAVLMVRFGTAVGRIRAVLRAFGILPGLVALAGFLYHPAMVIASINAVNALVANNRNIYPLLGHVTAYLLPALLVLCVALMSIIERRSPSATR